MLIFRGKFLMFFLHLWSLEAHHSHTRLALIFIFAVVAVQRGQQS